MDTAEFSTFFALLSLLALGLAAAAGVAAVAVTDEGVRSQLRPALVPLALAVALTATLGSLYYSEVAHFTPCEYCWYQRIAMYPLVLTLAVALVRRDDRVAWYVLPPALGGAAVSIYHYQLQLFPEQSSRCDPVAPCTARFVDELGFVSIPFMALSGFVAVIGLVGLAARWSRGDRR